MLIGFFDLVVYCVNDLWKNLYICKTQLCKGFAQIDSKDFTPKEVLIVFENRWSIGNEFNLSLL